VVAFAIAGAFILSLTYVPMMSALFLSKNLTHKQTFSDRMMAFFQRGYAPLLRGAMRRKVLVLGVSVASLAGAGWLFTTLGGEFIPQLNEGDFAVEVRVRTGSSLSQTIEKTEQVSRLLRKQFPEVREVIGKIGSGEIPTDPMPIEACDLMVILKPQNEWTSAGSMDELAIKMAEALEVIPGVEFGFQQPIQMRFNELISGAKQDVAVKIFGEDLAELTRLAGQLNGLVSSVTGATDVYVEQVSGLPQIVVQVDREALARYGLSVDEVNQTVSAAFAGQNAGLVYEGERRYDLTVRLAQNQRTGIEDVRALTIPVPDGRNAASPAVPLSEVATVELRPGPNQIQREDAKRRLTVAFNVRGRDVESVVLDLQQKINSRIKFPPGYYVTYGGQFENLIDARERLSIAVPVALALIFLLLFLTFGSVQQSLLIFSAIPLAAIGGVLALWLRDMPFSISAGVGFIALFGVAVLNGIVLIGEFNRLRLAGESDLVKVIFEGTAVRLRPVLMTAMVASLGFMPMALSSSAGAEVQKPLATVVIGGLLTATLLTLFVLPILYVLIERRFGKKFGEKTAKSEPESVPVPVANWLLIGLIGLSSWWSPTATAQVKAQPTIVRPSPTQAGTGGGLSLGQALQQASANNPLLRVSQLNTSYQQRLRGTAGEVGKTDVGLTLGQYNSRYFDQSFIIGQRLPNPAFVRGLRSLAEARTAGAEAEEQLTRAELTRQVKATYYQLWYVQSLAGLLRSQDSLYAAIARGAEVRKRTGEGTLLEQTAAEVQRRQAQTALIQNGLDAQILARQLQTLLASSAPPTIPDTVLTERTLPVVDSSLLAQNPELTQLSSQIEISRRETDLEAARLKPDFVVSLTNQSLRGFAPLENGEGEQFNNFGNRFTYGQVGVSLPLFGKPGKARVAAARIGQERAEAQRTARQRALEGEVATTIQTYQKNRQALGYYRESALPQAGLIREQVTKSYRAGEIGYVELLQNLRTVSEIQTGYLAALNDLNQTLINLDFLLGRTDQ
jgi:heavy metal efflux system protein